jgi:hypothetical protein
VILARRRRRPAALGASKASCVLRKPIIR